LGKFYYCKFISYMQKNDGFHV